MATTESNKTRLFSRIPAAWTGPECRCFFSVFFLTFALYLFTLPPSITLEDSGELVVAAEHFGVPHPPGYPLWTLLGGIWLRLAGWAFRSGSLPDAGRGMAAFSALFGALTCATASLLIRRLLGAFIRREPAPPANLTWWKPQLFFFPLSLVLLWAAAPLAPLVVRLFFSVLLSAALQITQQWTCRKLSSGLIPPSLSSEVTTGGFQTGLAVAGGLLLGLSPLIWSQSVIVEVYTLHSFFTVLLLTLAFSYLQHPRERTLRRITFLFALGLANHHSLLFLAPVLLLAVILAQPRPLRLPPFPVLLRSALVLMLLTAAGLSLYAYLPLASRRNPPMNWGNAKTMEGFRSVITRHQYGGFSFSDNLRSIQEDIRTPLPPTASPQEHEWVGEQRTTHLRRIGLYLHSLQWNTSIANQFSLAFNRQSAPPRADEPPPPQFHLPLALLGLLPLFFLPLFPSVVRKWLLVSLAAFFLYTVFFITLQWPEFNYSDLWVKRVQYLPAHTLFSMWMTLGAALLCLLILRLRPRTQTLRICMLGTLALFVLLPLRKELRDPAHIEHVGTSSQRGHDFGWRIGHAMLRGINGILTDGFVLRRNPAIRLGTREEETLRTLGFTAEAVDALRGRLNDGAERWRDLRSSFLRSLDLSPLQRRQLRETLALGAFHQLDPEERAEHWRDAPGPPPDLSYPPELPPGSIYFGGTDPGRFIPTYFVFSARIRPDIIVLTQSALADPTYMEVTRRFYGEDILLPDPEDVTRAFIDYTDELRVFEPEAYAQVTGDPTGFSLQNADQVNAINDRLSRRLVEQNAPHRRVFLEQAVPLPWMVEHLQPHGLIFEVTPEPSRVTQRTLRQSQVFWDWIEQSLQASPRPRFSIRSRYERDVAARTTYSKLRMAQGWNFFQRGLHRAGFEAVEQAIRLYPANPEATFKAAEMAVKRRDFDRAEAYLDQFAAYEPHYTHLPVFRRAIAALRRLDEKRLELEREMSLRVTGNTALQLMQIYQELRMEPHIREMAEILFAMNNLDPAFYPFIAERIRETRDPDLYRKALEAWSRNDPQNREPRRRLAEL